MDERDLLKDWYILNNREVGLMTLDEHGVADLLDRELNGKARRSFIERIHKRLTKLRGQRELAALLNRSK